jgi:hypothetical protein
MKTYGGIDVYIHIFLTSALVGGEWSALLRGKSSQCPLDRGLSGPQNRSGRRREEKNLSPTGTRTPTPLPSSPVSQSLSRLPIHIVCCIRKYCVGDKYGFRYFDGFTRFEPQLNTKNLSLMCRLLVCVYVYIYYLR